MYITDVLRCWCTAWKAKALTWKARVSKHMYLQRWLRNVLDHNCTKTLFSLEVFASESIEWLNSFDYFKCSLKAWLDYIFSRDDALR